MRYGFGEHELDVDQRELRRAGASVALEPQTFDVLTYLVRHRDRVVAKEELMDEVWGGRFVSETAVTSRIKQARRALGDDGQAQGFIRTHHGRGYRFVAEAEELESTRRSRPAGEVAGEIELPVLDAVATDGAHLAYHLAGQGPPDVVLIYEPGRRLATEWDDASRGRYLRGVAGMGRLVRHERRSADLDGALQDLLVVLDAAACERAVLVGEGSGALLAAFAAATHGAQFPRVVLWAADLEAPPSGHDVRSLLPTIEQRTLVLHRTGDRQVPVEASRLLAAQIPRAELAELPGSDHAPEANTEQVLDALEEIIEDAAAAEAPDQSLTALVGLAGTDTEALSSVLVSLGGRVRRGPERALVISFDGPAIAVRALGSRRARGFLASVGVGVAIDEVARGSDLVSGHGVDVARLLALRAQPGEVLVPNVIRDLLAGSGLHVESVGTFNLPHVGPHPAHRWIR